MPDIFTPLELLEHLEATGYRLRLKDGRLYGPPGLAPEIVELVKYHKSSLIALITHQCPLCNQPIREALNTDNVLYIECVSDPAHFAHAMPKHRGMMFLTSGGVKPEKCVQCGLPNDGPYKYCGACWLKLIEEDMAAQSEAAD